MFIFHKGRGKEIVCLYIAFPVFRDDNCLSLSRSQDRLHTPPQAAKHILCAIRKKYLFALSVLKKKSLQSSY